MTFPNLKIICKEVEQEEEEDVEEEVAEEAAEETEDTEYADELEDYYAYNFLLAF